MFEILWSYDSNHFCSDKYSELRKKNKLFAYTDILYDKNWDSMGGNFLGIIPNAPSCKKCAQKVSDGRNVFSLSFQVSSKMNGLVKPSFLFSSSILRVCNLLSRYIVERKCQRHKLNHCHPLKWVRAVHTKLLTSITKNMWLRTHFGKWQTW